jgi:hypothetical protein
VGGLKLAVAKRMYRFLDKRFHFSSELRFNLPVFACEHIGLSRRYDAAQLKRRLSPAIAELYRQRTQRFAQIVDLKQPDRVPSLMMAAGIMTRYAGISFADSYYDSDKAIGRR